MFKLPILRGVLRKKLERQEVKENLDEGMYKIFQAQRKSPLVMSSSHENIHEINVKYPLIEPFAYANIRWDPDKKELVYSISEPILTEDDKEFIEKLTKDLMELIEVDLSGIKNRAEAIKYLEEQVKKVIKISNIRIPVEKYPKIFYYIYRNFIGLNEIEPLMFDPRIEDIGCDGLNVPLYVVHQAFGSIKTGIMFTNSDQLRNFVIKLAERCGRYVSYAEPLLDGTLPDGARIQASLASDVTTHGPTFSIRKFKEDPFSPTDLIKLGTASPEMMSYLWLGVEHGISVLICGGVATGKTSLLNSLSMFIRPEQKIVSIEDTRELNLPHENWIPSVSRSGFGLPGPTGEKYGEVTLFDLLRESFRQNPDYVIVGEVRGKEAYVMFQGMASGHPSMGTMHADSVDTVIKRLVTPPIELSPSLVEALDIVIVVVHAREKGKAARRIKEIIEIESVDKESGHPRISKVFGWDPTSDAYEYSEDSWYLNKLAMRLGISVDSLKKDVEQRKNIIDWMLRKKVSSFRDVSNMINLYYHDKETIIKWVSENLEPYSTKPKEEVERLRFSASGLRVLGEK